MAGLGCLFLSSGWGHVQDRRFSRELRLKGSVGRCCLVALEVSIANARKILGGMDDAALMAKWELMRGERERFAVPRAAFLRSIILNHWYHHRGQLTMYLRQLGVPLPSIYGPSGDEKPFA